MGLFHTAVTGAMWTTTSSVIRSLVSLLQVSILTKFLEKADFGIVAIAVLFIGFTSIFLDLGISIGILHKQEISRREYSSLFWLNIITGLLLTIVLIIMAPMVSYMYSEPELTPIIQLLCFGLFFSSLGNQHRTVQQKKLRFKLMAIVEIISSFLTIVVAVYTVCNGFGVYSLVYSSLFASLCPNLSFLIIGLTKDNNISFHFSIKETYPFLKIGGYNIAAQVLDYFSREVDVLIISATLGKEALGVYSLCKKIVVSLYSSIMPIYNKVLVPLLSKLQSDKDNAQRVTYDIIETVAITNFPLFLLIAIFPGLIIHTFYGDNYMEGIYVLSILAVHYGYMSPGSPASALQVAFGRTDIGFYWTICRIIIFSSSAYIGAQLSIEGMVIAIFIGSLLSSPFGWRITIFPLIGGYFYEYFKKTFCPFLLTFSIAFPFWLLFKQNTNLMIVAIMGGLFLTIYTLLATRIFRNTYIVEKFYLTYKSIISKYERN